MIVNANVLASFLTKIKMKGSQGVDECVIDFQADGVVVHAHSPTVQAIVSGTFYASNFKEYQPIGKIAVNELDRFIKLIGRFVGDVTLKKEANVLVLMQGNKQVDVELIEEKFVTVQKAPTLKRPFDEKFAISSTALNDIFDDAALSKDSVLNIETGDGVVTFTNTGKYKFKNVIACSCKTTVKAKFGAPIVDALKNLEGQLEISMASDYPLQAVERNDNMIVTILVAPQVDTEEDA